MELLILLSFVLIQGSFASLNSTELVEKYGELKRQNHQNGPRSSDDERLHFREFKKNSDRIEAHNHEEGRHWTAGYNQFTTMTVEEKESYTGLNVSRMIEVSRRQIPARMARRSVHLNKRQNPSEVNHEDKMVDVKSQGLCGSCWTFSAAASLEYQINRDRTGAGRSLSEQYIVNCFNTAEDGCLGGWPADVWDWIQEKGDSMLPYNHAIPYVAADEGFVDGCSIPEGTTSAIAGWTVWGANYLEQTDAALEAAVANERIGVVSVAIAVIDSMYSYQSGVYDTTETCDIVNHAVNVVGYGEQDGEAYFRVRNSWGANWGDNGHVNMKRGVNGENLNTCLVSQHGHYPIITGSDAEETEDQDTIEELREEVLWCVWTFYSLDEYCSGTYRYSSITVAQSQCEARSDCSGVTYETSNRDETAKYTLRKGAELRVSSSFEMSWLPCQVVEETECAWVEMDGVMLNDRLTDRIYTVEEGKLACDDDVSCVGISCKNDLCMLNASEESKSKNKFTSYVLDC